ncbi:MAG: hypothetical protein ACRDD7_15930 [Peptostreptococcaceae bacterium]
MEHNCGCNQGNFQIATIDSKEKEAIQKAEQLVKQETGKDFVMIAWEQK